ncbi:MarR family transcriptional regulator [Allostella sp. ATCC 35155]|nr:MarR family transcriptional regulator [Stella sp. ATCC 35155]
MRKRYDRKARALGLSRAQWSVLAHLSRNEGIHQGGLADILEVEPITLARMVDRLEGAGLVERRSDPTDRRVKRLHMMEAAAPVLEQMRTLGADTREEALAGIAGADREQMVELLARMKANLLGLDPCDPETPDVPEAERKDA